MITVDIRKAKRRFGRKPRGQWRFTIRAANGRNLSTQDTYANTGDITSMLRALRSDRVQVRIHYDGGAGQVFEL